jgi:6-phosphofructokinase 1
LENKDFDKILNVFRKRNIRYLLVNGGDDTMANAYNMWSELSKAGYELHILGIPKTIDNDIGYTDHCPGYGSAAKFIVNAARYLDMESHSLPVPITILETMGRNAGWLAASTYLAKKNEGDGPHLIYVPEHPFDIEDFLSDVESLYSRYGRAFVVVSEGIRDKDGNPIYESGISADTDQFGHKLPGNVSQVLSDLVSKELGLRARNEKPGLLGRAWVPLISEVDQEEAIQLGKEAVKRILEGEKGIMLKLIRESNEPYQCSIGKVKLTKVAGIEKTLPHNFINKEGNFINEDFRSYVEPLIGETIPPLVKFFSMD